MGLASKLGTPAPSAPPLQGATGGAPPGYPQIGAQQGGTGQPPKQPQPGGQYGAPPTGQYGGPPQTQFGQPGQVPTQPGQGLPGQGQYGQVPTQPGQGLPGQGQYGQPPQGQFGQNPQGQYGQNPQSQFGQSTQGQFGQTPPGQYVETPGQYGQRFGSNPPSAQSSFNAGHPGSQPGSQQNSFNYGHPGMQQNAFNQGRPMQQPSFNQGQPGQFNQMGAPGGQGIFTAQRVLVKLQQLVQENGLHHFYPPQKLQQVAQFVASKDVQGLGQRWRLPNEVTMDLVGLALYDICIYCDDSGSMAFEEGGERIDDLKAVLGRTADAATLFDTDGIVVRFMNSTVEGNGIHSEAEASNLIAQIRFSGTTPLGTALDRKVMQPMVLGQARSGNMPKPVLVICITDGEPTGEPKDTVRQVIMNAKQQLANTPFGAGAVAFQFAQVGKDAAATRFLHALDVDPVIGGMVDTTAHFEQEQEEYSRKGIQLDPSLYLVKLMVGGIDRSYDEGDE